MSDYDPPFHPDLDGESGTPGEDGEGIFIPPQSDAAEPSRLEHVSAADQHDDPAAVEHASPDETAERADEWGGQRDADQGPERWSEGSTDAVDAPTGEHDAGTDSYPDLSALTNAGRHAVAAPPPPVAAPEPVPETAPAEPVDQATAPPVEAPAPPVVVPAQPPVDEGPAPASAPTATAGANASARPARAKKPGPKPMTDEPTVRVEGQLYVTQQTAGVATLARLKVENKAVPAAERRRLSINTLIRVGMTIVLEHADELHGKTEAELLESLRAALRADSGRTER